MLKRFLLCVIYALLLYGAWELAGFSAFYVTRKKAFSFAEVRREQEAVLNPDQKNDLQVFFKLPVVIHPYLGSVHNPDSWFKNETMLGMKINDEGFFDTKQTIQAKSSKRLVVGVFGGSVAWWLSSLGAPQLKAELEKIPQFAGRKILLVRIAIGAYKQPQQLMALSYFLSRGAHFDVVINVDGFNEIAIPATHNIPKQIHPLYPSYWHELFTTFMEAGEQRDLKKTAFLEELRRICAAVAVKRPLRWSVSASVLWTSLDGALNRRIMGKKVALKERQADTGGKNLYLLRGPHFDYSSPEEFYERLAEHWKQSSLLMWQICRERNIAYFHFLQPNQYVPGSKPIGEEERRTAIDETLFWQKEVHSGYPKLIAKGKELEAAGVPFYDMTMMFKDIAAPVYVDTCCHLTVWGNGMLGTAIGSRVAGELSKQSAGQ